MAARHARARMREVVEIVAAHEGGIMPVDVSRRMSYQGRTKHGWAYAAIWRAVDAGLVSARAHPDRRRSYLLFPKQ